jgi:hypothetical protein
VPAPSPTLKVALIAPLYDTTFDLKVFHARGLCPLIWCAIPVLCSQKAESETPCLRAWVICCTHNTWTSETRTWKCNSCGSLFGVCSIVSAWLMSRAVGKVTHITQGQAAWQAHAQHKLVLAVQQWCVCLTLHVHSQGLYPMIWFTSLLTGPNSMPNIACPLPPNVLAQVEGLRQLAAALADVAAARTAAAAGVCRMF